MKKNYLIYFLLLLFTFSLNVNASTNTIPRTPENNYGINKNWDVNEVLEYAKDVPYVNASEKIYDFADILTPYEEEELYELAIDFKKDTGLELIIYTTVEEGLSDYEEEANAVDFYDYNDFGMGERFYDGIVIYRNASSYPYYGAYFFGNAQLYYPPERSEPILDNVYHYFTGHRYVDAFKTMIYEYRNYYEKGKIPGYSLDDAGKTYYVKKYEPPVLGAFIISFIVTSIVMSYLINKNRLVRKATLANEYLDIGSVKYTKKSDIFIRSHTSSRTIQRSSSGRSYGGGGGFSSGGSSGGSHSGGGRRG